MKKIILSLTLIIAMMMSIIPFGVIAVEDSSLPFVQNLHLGDIDNGESPRTIYWDPVEGAARYAIYVKNSSGKVCHATTVFDKDGIQSHFFYYMDYTWETFPAGIYEFEIWAVDSDGTHLTQRTYLTYNYSNVIKAPNVEINISLKVNEAFEIDLVNDASELHKSVYNNNYHIVVKNEEDVPSWMSIDEKGVLRGTAPNTCIFGESFTIYFETGADARAFSVNYSLVSDGKEYAIQNLTFAKPHGCEYAYYRKQGYGDSVYGVWPVLYTVNFAIGTGIGSYSPQSNQESNLIKSVDWDFRKWNPETKEYELFDSDEMFTVGHYAMFMLVESKKSDADGKKTVFADDMSITVGSKTVPAKNIGVLGYDSGSKLGVFLEEYYLYDYKPRINSVTVNGTELADGETTLLINKNLKIETNYGNLYYVLEDYGCSVKQLSAYYLNGEKINVAMINPVDNGDGTSTKTYSRTLNGGDVLTVESWLEVTWPNGYKDRVDEHTVTVMNVGADFDSLNPVPSASELTNKYTDLGTMDLGSAETNIDFKGFPEKLSAEAIADGWTTGRSISVTRDGVEIYNRTYADNERFGWNLKDNIDEGGTYLITLRVFAQKGEQIVEKTHKFRVFVKGSTIKTIYLEGVGTPIIGKSPSTIKTVKSNTDGVVVNKVVWTEYKQGDGGVWDWFNMSAGSKFESGKRYAVIVELQTEDGYSFTANKADMTVYINGQKAKVNAAYSSDAFGVTLEFDPVTTPVFTTQPVGGEAPYGDKYTINWATNFTPCKIIVGEYNSLNQVVNQVEYSNTTTSVELPANQYGYVVIAYYNDANAKYSNKITITEATPVFTMQPVGGEVAPGEKLNVTWATNFTPVKSVLMQVVNHPVDGPVTTRKTLGTANTAEVGAGYDYYFIRAYTETGYVDSDKFTITELASVTITKQPTSVTVATGETASTTVTATGEGLTYTWYYTSNGKVNEFYKSSVTGATYTTTMDATRDGRKVYCVITDKYGNSVTTNTVTLSMKSGLAITKQPTNVTVANGEKAATTVTATGEGLTYTWYYTLNKNGVEFYKSSVTGATYTTTMDESRAGRKVYCVITDKYGNSVTTNTVTLSMKSGLAITKQPTNVTVANGEKAATTVTATGEGLKYTWYYTSNKAGVEFFVSSVTGATYSTTMDATRDGRKVYCVITDKYGNTVKTNTVTLSMKSGLAITKQPTNVTVANGEKAATTVTATGEGLKYTWYYTSNGKVNEFYVSSVTGATYSTTMDATRDGRKVYCVITDKYGNSVTTNTVTLSMKSGLAITKQPTNVTVANGEKAATTVTATGEGLTYTWYYTLNKNGVEFYKSSVTGATYSTTMDESRAGRKVYCVITDKYGNSVTTNTVTLSMKSGLAITKQPTNVTVANGEKAATTVTATGEGLTYTWYYTLNKNGVEFYKSSVTGATYTTTMDESRAGRKVYCVITDKYGNTVKTNTVTLSMK